MMVKNVFLDVINKEAYPILINDEDIEAYHKILGYVFFDIIHRKIGNRLYSIYCDDNGLLKKKQVPSACDSDGNVVLVGNLIIANANLPGESSTLSLSQEDVDYILDHIIEGSTQSNQKVLVLKDVE